MGISRSSLPSPSLNRSHGPGPSPGLSIGPGSYSSLQDRMEIDRMEKEKRERELAELRDRENRMRDEMFRRGAMRIPGLPPHDPYLEASRRHAAAMGQQSPYGPVGADRMAAERMAVERMALSSLATDPLIRLQMAGINPEVSAHTHTHLHMHPDAAALMGIPGFPGMRSPYPPGAPRHPLDLGQPGIRPPPDYLSNLMRQQAGGLPGAAAAAQQLAGHDALQRQLMFERERGLLGAAQQAAAAAAGSGLAASQHLQQLQMEEYHRAARDREIKVRTLEEAARQAGQR